MKKNITIGILGGGQLGRMLAAAASQFGYRVIILSPEKDSPAAQLANEHIVSEYENETALKTLASKCDIITYEFENVPLVAARFLEQIKKNCLYPSSEALRISQDRILEKQFLQSLGFSVAPFCAVNSLADLQSAFNKFGKGLLKACRFGYDGKGQYVIENENFPKIDFSQNYIFEKFQDFEYEFSYIACRGKTGEFIFFDSAQNIHKGGILHKSIVPSNVSASLQETVQAQIKKLLEKLNYVGVMGIEFFCVGGGAVVNEIAPRVHNSGHWTEICVTSQFHQHIRAIAGLPFGSVGRLADCEMINLIGDDINNTENWLANPNARLTLYGKGEARAGRKMGHVVLPLVAKNKKTC